MNKQVNQLIIAAWHLVGMGYAHRAVDLLSLFMQRMPEVPVNDYQWCEMCAISEIAHS